MRYVIRETDSTPNGNVKLIVEVVADDQTVLQRASIVISNGSALPAIKAQIKTALGSTRTVVEQAVDELNKGI